MAWENARALPCFMKHTRKVMAALFASWGPDDWFAKTSNLEKQPLGMTAVTPGQQQIMKSLRTFGKAQKFKGHFGYENGSLVGKKRHCIGIRKKYSHLRTPAHIQVSVSHQPWVCNLTWGLTHRLHLSEEDSTAPRTT